MSDSRFVVRDGIQLRLRPLLLACAVGVGSAVGAVSCLVTIHDPPAQGTATGSGASASASASGSGGGSSGAGGASPSYVDEVLADEPIGYYRLNDDSFQTAHDASKYHHDGVFKGSVDFQVSGALVGDQDTAAHFHGGYADFGDVMAFDFAGVVPFTLEAWIKPDEVDGSVPGGGIGGKSRYSDAGDGYDGYIWAVKGDKLRLHRTSTTGQSDTADSTALLSAGLYTHVVTVYSNQTVYHYINGQPQTPNTSTAQLPDLTEPFLIANSGGWGMFTGAIDEFAIYDHALTAERVKTHYEVGVGAR